MKYLTFFQVSLKVFVAEFTITFQNANNSGGNELLKILRFSIYENKKKDIIQLISKFKRIFKDNFLFEIQRINDQKIDIFEKEFINLSKVQKTSTMP